LALRIVNSVPFARERIFWHNLFVDQILAANYSLLAMTLVLNQLELKNTEETLIIVAWGLFQANPLPSCIILVSVLPSG
jgi:hypothetical protein